MSSNKITQLALSALIAAALIVGSSPAEARRRSRDRGESARVVKKPPKKIRSNGRSTRRTVAAPAAARKVTKRRAVAAPRGASQRREVRSRGHRRVVVKSAPARRVVVHKRRAPQVTHVRSRRPARRTVVVHRRRPATKVVHVHTPAPVRREVVHVHHDSVPEAVTVETVETVQTYREPEVDAYIGANLQSFTPSVAAGLMAEPDTLGLNVHAGLRFDDRIALEVGWTGTATGSRNGMQAGTIDAKAFLHDGMLRPYLLVGAGVFALQDAQLTDGVTMAGPGARLGAGLEIGDAPLTVNVGGMWQGMALTDLDNGPGELDLAGVSVGAGLSLNF